jgi:Family of unknown function (DUF5335)
MATSTKRTKTKRTKDIIEPGQWAAFLAQFTRIYRGAHATVEVLGNDVGYQVMTDDRPFDGVTADVKDGERSVWVTFGATPEEHLTHGVHNVTAIRMGPPLPDAAAVLEIEAADGVRTLLTVSSPEAFALPPGAHK